jgi:hypothetical protein
MRDSTILTITGVAGVFGLLGLYAWRERAIATQRIEMIRSVTALVCSLTATTLQTRGATTA